MQNVKEIRQTLLYNNFTTDYVNMKHLQHYAVLPESYFSVQLLLSMLTRMLAVKM